MLSSTGGWKRYSQEVEQPYAQAANTMYADLQKQARAEQFQGQQANVQNAMNLYNLLWSANLNQVQLRPKKQPKAPMDFPIFGNMYNANYLQPLSSYLPKQAGGPTVSPEGNPEYVPRYQPNLGSIGAERDALAQQEYNKAYLSYLNRQAAESKRQFDITSTQSAAENVPADDSDTRFGLATQMVIDNRSSENPLSKMALLQAINSALNMDIEAMAATDPRARALWELITGQMYGQKPLEKVIAEANASPWEKFGQSDKQPVDNLSVRPGFFDIPKPDWSVRKGFFDIPKPDWSVREGFFGSKPSKWGLKW